MAWNFWGSYYPSLSKLPNIYIPPPKKKKHHLCIFWYSKVKISHFGSKRSRNHQGCERFGYYILIFLHEGIIQEVKFMTVMYL